MTLLEILGALKDAEDPSSSSLSWAWRSLSEHIDRRYRLPPREHDDVRQRTLLKVLGAVAKMDADTPGRAEAWLRKVHRSAKIDHHRTRSGKMMDRALDTTPKDAGAGWVERVGPVTAAEESRDVDEEAAIGAALDAVLERCATWAEQNVESPMKRRGDLQRAQVALLANVRGAGYEAIVEALGVTPPPSKAAVYKWIERGRERVVLPALEGWEHPLADVLRELLVGARRADAGKPRPERRGAVSRGRKGPSKKGRSKK